jgi:hypothetical protein
MYNWAIIIIVLISVATIFTWSLMAYNAINAHRDVEATKELIRLLHGPGKQEADAMLKDRQLRQLENVRNFGKKGMN